MRRARNGKKNNNRERWKVTWHQHADPRLQLQLQRPRPSMVTEHVARKQQQFLLAVLPQQAGIINNWWQLSRDVTIMVNGRQHSLNIRRLQYICE